jgi:hypothetical protein
MNIEIIKEYFTLKVDEQNYQIEFERPDQSSLWTMRIISVDQGAVLYTRKLAADITVNAELAQEIAKAYVNAISGLQFS